MLKKLLPKTAIAIAKHGTLSIDSHARDLEAMPQALARCILPHLLESWQLHRTAAADPLHNSTDPTVLAQLAAERMNLKE